MRTDVTLKELSVTGDHGLFSTAFFNCLTDIGGAATPNPAYAGDRADAEARARALAQAWAATDATLAMSGTPVQNDTTVGSLLHRPAHQ